MNFTAQDFTRDEWTATVAPGQIGRFVSVCDYWFIDCIDVGAEGGASVKVDLKVNKARNYAKCGAGQSAQGRVGLGDHRYLDFQNNTASTVFIRVIFGNGECNFAPNTTIQNATLSLPQAQIDALNAAPTATTYGPNSTSAAVAAGGLATNFLYFSLYVVSGVVTVNGTAIPVGVSVEFNALGATFSNPAYDASGGVAIVSGTRR